MILSFDRILLYNQHCLKVQKDGLLYGVLLIFGCLASNILTLVSASAKVMFYDCLHSSRAPSTGFDGDLSLIGSSDCLHTHTKSTSIIMQKSYMHVTCVAYYSVNFSWHHC